MPMSVREMVREEMAQMIASSGQIVYYDTALKQFGIDAAFAFVYDGSQPVVMLAPDFGGELRVAAVRTPLIYAKNETVCLGGIIVLSPGAIGGESYAQGCSIPVGETGTAGVQSLYGGGNDGTGDAGAAQLFGGDAADGDAGGARIYGGASASGGKGGDVIVAGGPSGDDEGGSVAINAGPGVTQGGAWAAGAGNSDAIPGITFLRAGNSTDDATKLGASIRLRPSFNDPDGFDGVVEINVGSVSGSSKGWCSLRGPLFLDHGYTIGELNTLVGLGMGGGIARVTDANVSTYDAVVAGGGSGHAYVNYDGSDWRYLGRAQ